MGRTAATVATLRVGAWKGDRSDAAAALGFRRTRQRGVGAAVRHGHSAEAMRWRENEMAALERMHGGCDSG